MGTFTLYSLVDGAEITFLAECGKEHSLLMCHAQDTNMLSKYFDMRHSNASIEDIAKVLKVQIVYGMLSVSVGNWVTSK